MKVALKSKWINMVDIIIDISVFVYIIFRMIIFKYNKIMYQPNSYVQDGRLGSSHVVVANVLDCDVVEFELQLC